MRIQVLSLILLTACAQSTLASDALLERLEPQGFVNDFAHIISEDCEQRLNEIVEELQQKTGAEIAVVTIHSLEGGDIDDFTNRLFERWGVGQKGKDNGIMFLAAMRDRKMRIEVGYGLEGAISDAKAGRIRRDVITPHFKAGKPSAGILNGVNALAVEIADDAGVSLTHAKPVRSTSMPDWAYQLIGFSVLLVISRIIYCIGFPKKTKRKQMSGSDYWWTGYHGGRGAGGSGFGGGGYSGGGGFGGGCSGGGGSSGGW